MEPNSRYISPKTELEASRYVNPRSGEVYEKIPERPLDKPVDRIVHQSTEPMFTRYRERNEGAAVSEGEHSRGQKRAREESPSRTEVKARRMSDSSRPVAQRNEEKEVTTTQTRPRSFSSVRREEQITRIQEHFLPMKGAIYMENIESGKKEYEGRINGPACQKMKIGDTLRLFDNRAGWGIICKITSKDLFYSFQKMLEEKGILKMLPQLETQSKRLTSSQLMEEGVKIYRGFPGSNRVATVGVVAIGVQFIKRVNSRQG